LHHLSTLLLPVHVQADETAQRFRNEKYMVRMSRSGFGLLVGWLTEGLGGEGAGAGLGFSGDKGKKGRNSVMRVVNNHLRFDGTSFLQLPCLILILCPVTSAPSTSIGATAWEESTGLLSALLPPATGENAWTSAQAFNLAGGNLKLGPLPISEDLKKETERVLQESAMMDSSGSSDSFSQQQNLAGMISPTTNDLLPHPPTFQTADVRREIERVKDARKRIRLEPSVLGGMDPNSYQATSVRSRALPSICAYTMHEAGEGWAICFIVGTVADCTRVPCATFSQDNSLMATGFSEGYVRLWSLKNEKLKGMRSDFQASSVKDGKFLAA
jgi:transcription initiation factor TFIID subunit 5